MSALAAVAESRIQEAIEAGGFDHLEGRGRPLDLDAYFAAPPSLRAGFGLLKSAGVVPPEVEAMRGLQRLRELAERASDPANQASLRAEIRARETELAMALERMKRTFRSDAGFGA